MTVEEKIKKQITLDELKERLFSTKVMDRVCQNSSKQITISEAIGSSRSLFAHQLFHHTSQPIAIISSEEFFDLYRNDLVELFDKEDVLFYDEHPHHVLSELILHHRKIILLSLSALSKPVITKEAFSTRFIAISQGEKTNYDAFVLMLENGFQLRDFVENEGEYAIRGGIVDVFSFGDEHPTRIEFSGDEVTSIRTFDIDKQISTEKIAEKKITFNIFSEKNTCSVLSYFSKDTIVIKDFDEEYDAKLDEENWNVAKQELQAFRCIEFKNNAGDVSLHTTECKSYHANFKALSHDIQNGENYISTSSLKEFQDICTFIEEESHQSIENLFHIKLNLFEGFAVEQKCLFTKYEITGKFHSHTVKGKSARKKITIRSLQGIKIGDYLVHEDHGVGRFIGMEKITVDEAKQECVMLEYQGEQKLYVNIQKIRCLSKYSSAESSPTLAQLGSSKWGSEKTKSQKKIKDIARKLILLYAKRKTMKAPSLYKENNLLLKEFESGFVFDETPDQLQAIQDVYKELDKEMPMDRLICGDAGFGKTEVSMRAACKAIEAGKQVAVLVPTTVLAHQHYSTFKKRFAGFPVKVEVISRFITKEKLKTSLEGAAEGKVDILIGTHRMLFANAKFKELALLVIDEEQRFGVEVKEKLRESFPNVHTLFLSATPIPRTLQLAIVGAKGLSIISTPPKNRQPIETTIHNFDETLIRSVIDKELKRGGQVFFLHNRIDTIENIKSLLQGLHPKARIGIAHGRMSAKDIEEIIFDFIEQEIDILVSTTIIGLGIDISNANTLIINRADMFGLSELYQLRGRVGRSDRKAYCYLLVPMLKTLTKEALARLSVIEEFTEFGAGFNVALQDLDIRGAGDVFGVEQSGFIAQFGFEMYQKVLEEAIIELKTTEFKQLFEDEKEKKELSLKKPECEISVFFDAFIPSYYVESVKERFNLYSRLSKVRTLGEILLIENEIRDRFSKIPEPCENLFFLSKMKLLGGNLYFQKIEIYHHKLIVTLPSEKEFYQSHIFDNIHHTIKENMLSQFSPAFKQKKYLQIEFSFEEDTKNNTEKLQQDVLKILKTFITNHTENTN